MEFKRAKKSLNSLEQKDQITATDLLGVFEELCADVTSTGTSIPQLELGDAEVAARLIRTHGRILLKIASDHPELYETKRPDRFKEICDKLGIQDEQFEKVQKEPETSPVKQVIEGEELSKKIANQMDELETIHYNVLKNNRELLIALMMTE